MRTLLDTNVYVDWINAGLRAPLLEGSGRIRYLSSVVEVELRVGAHSRAAVRGLDQLIRAYQAAGRRVAPSPNDWSRAAGVLRALHAAGRDVRRSSLVHDVLIALTARSLGATVVSRDADFEVIRRHLDFALEIVP